MTEEEKEEEKKEEGGHGLHLFDPSGVRKKAHWQCMKYIAPNATKKKWKAVDAVGVYCTVCKTKVNYDSGKNPLGIQRHMTKYHQKLLDKYDDSDAAGERNKRKIFGVDAFFPKKPKNHEDRRMATAVNQQQFYRLAARWTSTSLRPFSIVEDGMLQEIIDFASNVSGALKLPSRNTNRKYVMEEYIELKTKVEKDIRDNCQYFCTTSDMWSSRTLKAFMALTVHYLTKEFQLRNFTLEVKPVLGKHTGDMIRNEMVESFQRWNLRKSNLTMMLRDSGSNMVKACEDWDIKHFPCIGHSMHLLVGPFLVVPKTRKDPSGDTDGVTINENDENGLVEDDDDDLYDDSFDIEGSMVLQVRNLVQELRKFSSLVKNSTKCIERMELLQKQLNGSNETLKVKMDVRTRWNSTLDMLMRMVQLMEPINDFLSFYNSAAGKKEFKGTNTKLAPITDEKWAIIKGICYLMAPFGKATVALSGEKYSTFVSALPILRKVKGFISDPNLFQFHEDHLTKTKRKYFDLYGSLPFFDKVVKTLEACRVLLVAQFNQRFSNLDSSILWTTLLDPRFGLNSSHWKNDEEKEAAKKLLLHEVEDLALPDWQTSLSEQCIPIDVSSTSSEDDFDLDFSKPASDSLSSQAQYDLERAKLTVSLTQEVKAFLLEDCKDNPLNWWNQNCFRYPNIARVARKWLAVTATSTPSERVFSICGLVDTAKRSKMLGASIEAQVFVHNNYDECIQLQ